MTDREAHVTLLRLRQPDRERIWACARAVKDARSDRQKRRRADRDLRQLLAFYEAVGKLSHAESEGIYFAIGREGF